MAKQQSTPRSSFVNSVSKVLHDPTIQAFKKFNSIDGSTFSSDKTVTFHHPDIPDNGVFKSLTRMPMSLVNDGFVRVCSNSHRRRGPRTIGARLENYNKLRVPLTDKVQTRGSSTSERSRKIVFGETDYLRDKLGFCMPKVEQTLATETLIPPLPGTALGHRFLTKRRMITIQNLLEERLAQYRPSAQPEVKPHSAGGKRGTAHSVPEVRRSGCEKRGTLDSKLYIVLMGASHRRAKYTDDRSKFALSSDMCRMEAKRLEAAANSRQDLNLLALTKYKLSEEKERNRKKREMRLRKKVKIVEPKGDDDSSGDEEYYKSSQENIPE